MTKNTKAFSLMEIIVVVLIVSIIGALSVKTYKNSRLKSMTNAFVSEVFILKNSLTAYWESYRTLSALAAEDNALDAESIKPFLGTFSKNSSALKSLYNCQWQATADASTPANSSISLKFPSGIPELVLEIYDKACETLGSKFDKTTGIYKFIDG